jgi:hypothetical protein
MLIERAIEADAEESVENPAWTRIGRGVKRLQKASQTLAGIVNVREQDVAILEMRLSGAGVIAIMAFARENPDGIAGSGKFEETPRQEPADLLDDLAFRPASGPSGVFPLAHLLNRNDRDVWQAGKCSLDGDCVQHWNGRKKAHKAQKLGLGPLSCLTFFRGGDKKDQGVSPA